MSKRFEFTTAGRIIFGAGVIREAGAIAKDLGRRALVVTGRNAQRAEPLLALLAEQGLDTTVFAVPGEPDLNTVRSGVEAARSKGCDLVLSLGGGSALDAGKTIAALLRNEGDVLDYLEVIGSGKPLSQPSIPFVAIPTTAGTGSEVTRNAVLASPEHRAKVSLRSPLMLPRLALVDPELTYDLPPDLTANTGMDALTQLIEPVVCLGANPASDPLCVEGICRVARSLRKAASEGRDAGAREDMALAGLFGGLALTNAGLGVVHGLAGPIGGMFPAPHGALCAALLPHAIEMNVRALRQRQPSSQALPRYEQVGRLLTGDPESTTDDGADWVRQLVVDLKIPPLRRYGVTIKDTPEIIKKAAFASSMKANPIKLLPNELTQILERAI